MLYNVVVNDWGETTYVPTTLGNILLFVLILLLLGAATFFAKKAVAKLSTSDVRTNAGFTAKKMAFCAMTIALATVLSYIKLFHFPTGGSITLFSMLCICLPGIIYGLEAGIITGIAYGILQLIIDPYVLYPMQLIVDYILAFGAMGLSGLFYKAKKAALLKGYCASVLGRYVFAVISGWIFFGTYAWEGWGALTYSLAYNAIYIFAEAAATILLLLIPPFNKAMNMIIKMGRQ